MSTPSGNYTIRNMTRSELDTAVEWAAQEGWNPGLHDAQVFWDTDNTGYFIGLLDDKSIACISAVKYPGNFAFVGFYIVHPDYRGQGYGLQIWNKAMQSLEGYTVGLDGVFAQQQNYAKSGSVLAHRNLRMAGIAQSQNYDGQKVTATTNADFALISELDRRCFGFDRQTFLHGWLQLPDSYSFKFVDNKKLLGYGVIRKCRNGYKIGPLFAEGYEVANELYTALTGSVVGQAVYLDVPEVNVEAMRLARQYGLTESFGTARMYSGSAPSLPYNNIFGVTTFELG